jgi:hypothetical protein
MLFPVALSREVLDSMMMAVVPSTRVGASGESQSSAHRFLHERADPCLFGGSQLLQRKGGRPHVPFVEVRLVAEADRPLSG